MDTKELVGLLLLGHPQKGPLIYGNSHWCEVLSAQEPAKRSKRRDITLKVNSIPAGLLLRNSI